METNRKDWSVTRQHIPNKLMMDKLLKPQNTKATVGQASKGSKLPSGCVY